MTTEAYGVFVLGFGLARVYRRQSAAKGVVTRVNKGNCNLWLGIEHGYAKTGTARFVTLHCAEEDVQQELAQAKVHIERLIDAGERYCREFRRLTVAYEAQAFIK